MKMKRTAFFCAIILSYTAFTQTTIIKNIGDYSILKVYNGIDVELIKSKEQKIEILGEKSEMVKIKSVNNTLKLSLPFSLKPDNNLADGKVLIKLYYNNNIDIIDANEGSTITGKDFNQLKLEVNSQERAFINLTSQVSYLKVRISSGGIIKLSGTAKNQEVSIDLYGVYNGFAMKIAGNSDVFAGTGAKAEIFAGQTLSARVNFGGSIFYKGNPEIVKEKKVIGGIIQKRN
jgi:hypothetical protein